MPKNPVVRTETAPPKKPRNLTEPNGVRGDAHRDKDFWTRVARTLLTSRAIDRIEEQELTPKGLVTYQFSARGHDLAQAILSEHITHPHDGAGVYYRSPPFAIGHDLT